MSDRPRLDNSIEVAAFFAEKAERELREGAKAAKRHLDTICNDCQETMERG